MRRSREAAARTRQEIVKAASTLLRERGLHGVSVANLMSEIGLTHGGFYTHFKSKEALMSEAMEAAFGETMNAWHKVASTKKRIGFTNLVDLYLGERHLKDPGTGCAVPALGSEIARASTAVQESVAKGINEMIEVLSKQIDDASPERKKERAIAILQKAAEDHYLPVAEVKTDPRFVELRKDARVIELLQKIGLSQ